MRSSPLTVLLLCLTSLVTSLQATSSEDGHCETIGTLDAYDVIDVGDTVYLDPAGKEKFTIDSLHPETALICDRSECHDATTVFSADAIIACAKDGYGTRQFGVIYLYDQPDEQDAAPDSKNDDQ